MSLPYLTIARWTHTGMLRQAWKPAAASIAVAGPAYYFYSSRDSQQTFELPVRVKTADGKKSEHIMKTLPLLPMKTVNSRLGQIGHSETNSRPYGVTWNHTTASLASNDPIEDAHSHQIIQSDDAKGDLLFYTVFDGHGGRDTSQLLSRTLINAVALQLSQLAANTTSSSSSTKSFTSALWGLWSNPSTPSFWDIPSVSSAIESAFVEFDRVLLDAPISILKQALQERKLGAKDPIPDLSGNAQAIQTMQAAISGSCALMAVFDTAQRDLYIACTGDSRAVAGVWEPSEDGKGAWKVDVLSEDQTARNPKEVERLRSEHPKSEATEVVMNGRVLGGLEPSRAFGDARYKWPTGIQELLNQVYMVGNGTPLRKPPKTFKTPPYVTAQPVVTHRKLSFDDPSSLRFLVIATDGLWDVLTPEEVVSLVGGHLAGLKGSISRDALPTLVPTSVANAGVDGKAGKQLARSTKQGSWAFVDDNLSTHLIRNALGGGDEKEVRQMMSIPPGMSRRYRDDVTVTVVWWEAGKEGEAKSTDVMIKSKL